MDEFVLTEDAKEIIAKKIVNELATLGIKVADANEILRCATKLIHKSIYEAIRAEEAKPVSFADENIPAKEMTDIKRQLDVRSEGEITLDLSLNSDKLSFPL